MLDQLKRSVTSIAAKMRQLENALQRVDAQQEVIESLVKNQNSITAEIDAIPGRRLYYSLTGQIAFDANDDQRRGQPISMLVSQDGPFIQTHYPFAVWRPTAPAGADMLGLWRPVSAWPLPAQFAQGNVDGDTDIISISYEITDSGSQRNFQNEAVPPILSRPDLLVPLPVPTLFTPNTTIQFTPTFNRILFNNPNTPPTEGVLVVSLPGYRVVNM